MKRSFAGPIPGRKVETEEKYLFIFTFLRA